MKSKLVALKDRSIIELRGPDSKEFLQGLISNDIHKIANDKLIYCAMLSPKGRFLYNFFIFEKNDSIFLDSLDIRVDEIIRKLSFYKLKKDITIVKNLDLKVFCNLNGEIENSQPAHSFKDPRSKTLGQRIYSNESKLESFEIINDTKDYEFTRIKNKIPESEKDLNYDKSIIVEYGLDNFNAIDYEKGCYVGQELTARTHHLGQVRKKIFYCKFDSQEIIAKNSEVFLNDTKIGLALSSIKYNNMVYGLIFIKIDDKFNKDSANLTADNIKIEILN